MPRILLLFLFFVGTQLAVAKQAKASDILKTGFVNIRKIMAEAPQLKQINEKLETEFEAQNQEIINMQHQIAQLMIAQYEKRNNKDRFIEIQKQIVEKQLDIRKRQQRLKNEYSIRRNEELGKLQTLIVDMVKKVSIDKKIDIVLNNTGVIYVNAKIDITPDVFEYLSEQVIE